MKDVPFFPYAPYLPQTEMSVTGASFSQKRVQLPPVAEEDKEEEVEERMEDNERVHSSVLAIHSAPLIACACTVCYTIKCEISCLPIPIPPALIRQCHMRMQRTNVCLTCCLEQVTLSFKRGAFCHNIKVNHACARWQQFKSKTWSKWFCWRVSDFLILQLKSILHDVQRGSCRLWLWHVQDAACW